MQPPAPPLGVRIFKRPVRAASHEEPDQNSKTKGCRNCVNELATDLPSELFSLKAQSPKTKAKDVVPTSYQPAVRLAQPLKSTAIPKNPLR